MCRFSILRPGLPGAVSVSFGRGGGWATLASLLLRVPREGLVHGHSVLTTSPSLRALSAFVMTVETRLFVGLKPSTIGSLPRRFPEWSEARRRRYVQLLSRAERVIAVSPELADFFVRIGIDQARVVEVGPLLPGIADAPTRPIRESVERVLRLHTPTLLTVGVMVPRYDFETIIGVFEEIR